MSSSLPNKLKLLLSANLKRARRISPTARLASLLFLAFSLPVTYCFTYLSGYDGVGWVRMTTPLFFQTYWLLGFAGVRQDYLVIHHENLPYLANISLLSGGLFNPDPLMSVRGLYPLLGAFFAPFCGPVKALMLLNYFYWALAAYVAWRFTKKLFNNELAALLAVLFVTGGIGWLTNLSDLSPHLASYSFYFLLTLILYESGVWQERRPLNTHLLLGVLLALARLNYENGLVLVLFYILVALRRNHPLHVLSGALLGGSSSYLWALHLNLYGKHHYANYQWVDFLHNTQHTLQTGLDFLRDNLNKPLVILQQYTYDFLQLLVALESLPLVLLGLFSWWALRRNLALCWFFAAGFLLQVGALVPQSSWPTNRGAYIYGASLFLIAPASYSLSRTIRARDAYRWLGLTAATFVLAFHFYWGTAQFWGNTAPLGTYQATVLRSIVRAPAFALKTSQPVVLSLTGAEPAPRLYWGKAGMQEAGALAAPPPPDWAVSWRANSRQRLIFQALQIRLPFLFYFTALLFLLLRYCSRNGRWPRRWLVVVMSLWLFVWLGGTALGALSNQVFWGAMNNIYLPPGTTLRYSIQLSGDFLQQLEKQLARDAFLEGFVTGEPGEGKYQLRLSIGGATVLEKESDAHLEHFPIPLTDELGNSFVGKLKQHKELTIEYSNHGAKDMLLYTWQRAGLPGRKLEATPPLDAQSARALPAFELRVRPRQPENRTLYLLGF